MIRETTQQIQMNKLFNKHLGRLQYQLWKSHSVFTEEASFVLSGNQNNTSQRKFHFWKMSALERVSMDVAGENIIQGRLWAIAGLVCSGAVRQRRRAWQGRWMCCCHQLPCNQFGGAKLAPLALALCRLWVCINCFVDYRIWSHLNTSALYLTAWPESGGIALFHNKRGDGSRPGSGEGLHMKCVAVVRVELAQQAARKKRDKNQIREVTVCLFGMYMPLQLWSPKPFLDCLLCRALQGPEQLLGDKEFLCSD